MCVMIFRIYVVLGWAYKNKFYDKICLGKITQDGYIYTDYADYATYYTVT